MAILQAMTGPSTKLASLHHQCQAMASLHLQSLLDLLASLHLQCQALASLHLASLHLHRQALASLHLQSLLDLLASLHLQSLLSYLFLLPFLRRPTS